MPRGLLAAVALGAAREATAGPVRCVAGMVVTKGGACANCPAGTYAAVAATACAPCPAGTFAAAGAGGCARCAASVSGADTVSVVGGGGRIVYAFTTPGTRTVQVTVST